MTNGKLIVVEGIDGVGKGTQSDLLVSRLTDERYAVEKYAFPRYGNPACADVEAYLNGEHGDPDKVDPYVAAGWFAEDRHAASEEMREVLSRGTTIICDRYVDSNAGHQGGKIQDVAEREKFLKWLYELEYEKNGVPRPDLVIILYAHADIGQRLVGQKDKRDYLTEGTHDGHEGNLEHLQRANDSFTWLARRDPNRYRLINCSPEGDMLSIETIHEMVWEKIQAALAA